MSFERSPKPSSTEHSMKVIRIGDTAVTRVADAAEYLGVHPNTLRRWADAGILPTIKLPSDFRRFPIDGLMRIKAQMLGEETALDLRKAGAGEKLRQFVMREITAEEAGPGFGHIGVLPAIKIDEEIYSFFAKDTNQAP